jgi:peroxiredoxin
MAATTTRSTKPPTTNADSAALSRRGQISIIAVVAIIIIAGTWLIGGREGFSHIGRGGINQSLLPKVGDVAPNFTAYDVNGNVVSLSDYHGQPVWLNFWGSWCPPCRAEMPDIVAANNELAPKGVVLLAVSLDEPPEAAARFAARNHATFRVLSDQDRAATAQGYPILNFPTHIFIDSNGVVRRIVLTELDEQHAVQYGNELLAESAKAAKP